jgi:hypothetical protein
MRQSRRVSIWTSLQRGDVITLCRQGVQCWKGSIEQRTDDGQTIWVRDQIGERRLFHVEDDYDLVFSGNVYSH